MMKKLLSKIIFSLTPVLLLANPGVTVDNGDGTFTYTQTIDEFSSSPYYTKPADYSGFGQYSGRNEDFSWQHDFPDYNQAGMTITSATLHIRAFDVDSESFHGTDGEYDVISVDGIDLNPGLLQGTSNTWSTTTFDIPFNRISDDGLINTNIDIDTFEGAILWVTKLEYSQVVIEYKFVNSNNAPEKPIISGSVVSDEHIITVVGPNPKDIDGDEVTYLYRWFVDVGQGLFTDDEVAGKPDHTGSSVPASSVNLGEIWRVEVTPVDEHGAIGPSEVFTWDQNINDKDNDGVSDDLDAYPEDATRAFNSYYPAKDSYNTLMFEDLWPKKGDYDLNDFVTQFNYQFVTDSNNLLKELTFNAEFIASGAGQQNGFAIAINGIMDSDIDLINSSLIVDGVEFGGFSAESGHSGEVVFVIEDNLQDLMQSNRHDYYYNTLIGDNSPIINVTMKVVLKDVINIDLAKAPFNPFIFHSTYGERVETHLIDHAPTALHTLGFGLDDDDSKAEEGRYYITEQGLPWAVEINGRVSHAIELIDFAEAYPNIIDWALSAGTTNQDWAQYPVESKLW